MQRRVRHVCHLLLLLVACRHSNDDIKVDFDAAGVRLELLLLL